MKARRALSPTIWVGWAAVVATATLGLAYAYRWETTEWKTWVTIILSMASALLGLALARTYTRLTGHAVSLDLQSGTQCPPTNPPSLAEWFVALIVPKRRSDGVLGDLEERFHRHVETRGLRRARWLYWAEALQSIAPILWTKAKRLGMIAAIAEIWQRTHS